MQRIYLHYHTSASYLTLIYVPATYIQWGKNDLARLSPNNGVQCERLHLTDLILDNSRRLLVWCVVCPAV